MKVGVNLKIDVSKIDKSKLFKGQKGTYLDAQVFIDIDQADQYDNNGMITQAISKQERDNGEKGNILGNCRVFWKDEQQPVQQAPQQASQTSAPSEPNLDFDDDIPF